jgi:hypothetical protein
MSDPDHTDSNRCAIDTAVPVVPVIAFEDEAEGGRLPRHQPITELFAATNDYPHIVFEKGQYYIIQVLNESSLIAFTEKKKAYCLDVAGIRNRNTHDYVKLSIGKEIDLLKKGPLKTQDVGEFSMRGFELPSPLHLALLIQLLKRSLTIGNTPAYYFYASVGSLSEPFLMSRVYPDPVNRQSNYYNSVKIYSLTKPISLTQLKNQQLVPIYKTDVSAKPDQEKIKNLIFDYEHLIKTDGFNAIIHFQSNKYLQLTADQKDDLQRVLSQSEVVAGVGFYQKYRFTQRLGSPYAAY